MQSTVAIDRRPSPQATHVIAVEDCLSRNFSITADESPFKSEKQHLILLQFDCHRAQFSKKIQDGS